MLDRPIPRNTAFIHLSWRAHNALPDQVLWSSSQFVLLLLQSSIDIMRSPKEVSEFRLVFCCSSLPSEGSWVISSESVSCAIKLRALCRLKRSLGFMRIPWNCVIERRGVWMRWRRSGSDSLARLSSCWSSLCDVMFHGSISNGSLLSVDAVGSWRRQSWGGAAGSWRRQSGSSSVWVSSIDWRSLERG